MSGKEYVERVTLIKFVKDNTPNIHGDTTMRSVQRTLKAVPMAEDVVKVVRCKDCKNIYHNPTLGTYRCPRFLAVVEPDDFCSYGERKEQT